MIDRLKIGQVFYSVEAEPRLIVGGSDGHDRYLNGHIQYHTCRIRIEAEANEQIKPQIVIHEALHGILHQAGFEDDHPEKEIIALGYGLIALLRDNPDFVRWVLDGATHG